MTLPMLLLLFKFIPFSMIWSHDFGARHLGLARQACLWDLEEWMSLDFPSGKVTVCYWHMAIEIVDLPMKNGDVLSFY